MASRRVIVVGNRGQDGRLLTDLLRARGDVVLGIGRDSIDREPPLPAVDPVAVGEFESVDTLVRTISPDEIYYLAAKHHSAEEFDAQGYAARQEAAEANLGGPVCFLEAIRTRAPRCRFFFASSSLVFGDRPERSPQTEETPADPSEPYAIAKWSTSMNCRSRREQFGVFASVGILYNHESIYRGPHFLSMKIARAAVAASRKLPGRLTIGDPAATADWGYAPDFADAFARILSLDQPGDFIVATGELHSVADFLRIAFEHVGLDWRQHVDVDPSILTRRRVGVVGDASKLRRLTGWRPTLSFEEMVRKLVDDVAREGIA